ncbi:MULTISPECIES: UvrD-helicase domain-containing protein [Gammaproteobacteria]|jgi:superfamily I DNA/RNA helicase|uniref:UvrD-helicase domain-containing protein n=1 Tax=Gammaproteobacteria TaxID=1236 RepID=UPI00214E7753|nr:MULTISPECIES: ATP-dependent helicase [Gammaproteobacteria]MCR3982040.1 ATP-dependent helicase [Aeromonas caviae]MDH2201711.1 ATP-dependent helicase [Pseudomonas oleovorans]MDX7680323.1 ATP-dependent helicase [Aeromonas caviae]MDX7699367.1 ATP-dependent helicase [Aeromonas caviae]MDX7863160.1 ATP-dependent helicase [Aeromonas caviae]
MAVLSRRVRPEDWKPVGVNALETNALKVVRSTDNRSVIAGPGAGKTELLAQRAAYLLQTGFAPPPRRILAISFKRDAATNLAARVRQRCHRSHAERFDSMTFDAFSKGLIDRFGQALPERWRPRPDYEIMFPGDRDYREFLSRQVGEPPALVGTYADIQAIPVKTFERCHLVGLPLPLVGWQQPTPAQWAADRFWQVSLHEGRKSFLSFPMIGRLAELVLRVNPMARDALRLTYSHLFMDEFQDTTQIQYDLVRTIFLGTDTVITAVGDNKQQIMRWAMAMDDPFTAFDGDFGATRTPLYNNYRSSPELVRIQHVLAQALDARAVAPVSKTAGTIAGDSCAIWDFSTPKVEAEHLATFVAAEMRVHALGPRDFVLLVRQKAGEYAAVLEPAFVAAGIPLRNEAGMVGSIMLQDLLVEAVSELIVAVLRLAMTTRAGRHWTKCQEALITLWGGAPDDEVAQARIAHELDAYVLKLSAAHPNPPKSKAISRSIVDDILGFIGRERVIAVHSAYGQGDWLEIVLDSAAEHLMSSSGGDVEWPSALDAYEGIHAIPLMTIHKSKGLEYHSVIFVGLDDGAWWSFSNDQIEATAGFFVAFTRAKQRVVFTYCAQRGTRRKIATLYRLLTSAGVKSTEIA